MYCTRRASWEEQEKKIKTKVCDKCLSFEEKKMIKRRNRGEQLQWATETEQPECGADVSGIAVQLK